MQGKVEWNMKGELLSSIELVLPPNVVEACYRLRRDGKAGFRAVNKEEGTSSEITLHRQEDNSVKIHIAGEHRISKKCVKCIFSQFAVFGSRRLIHIGSITCQCSSVKLMAPSCLQSETLSGCIIDCTSCGSHTHIRWSWTFTTMLQLLFRPIVV